MRASPAAGTSRDRHGDSEGKKRLIDWLEKEEKRRLWLLAIIRPMCPPLPCCRGEQRADVSCIPNSNTQSCCRCLSRLLRFAKVSTVFSPRACTTSSSSLSLPVSNAVCDKMLLLRGKTETRALNGSTRFDFPFPNNNLPYCWEIEQISRICTSARTNNRAGIAPGERDAATYIIWARQFSLCAHLALPLLGDAAPGVQKVKGTG